MKQFAKVTQLVTVLEPLGLSDSRTPGFTSLPVLLTSISSPSMPPK